MDGIVFLTRSASAARRVHATNPSATPATAPTTRPSVSPSESRRAQHTSRGTWCAHALVLLSVCVTLHTVAPLGVSGSAVNFEDTTAVARLHGENVVPRWAVGTLHTQRSSLAQLERVLLVVVRESAWVNGSTRVDGGAADRFAGIITAFAAAVAANATILLDWPELPRYYKPRFDFMYSDTEHTVDSSLLRLPVLKQFPFQGNAKGLSLLKSLKSNRITVVRVGHGFLNCFWNNARLYKPRGCTVPAVWDTDRLRAMTSAIPFRHAFRTLFDTLFQPRQSVTQLLNETARNVFITPQGIIPTITNQSKHWLRIFIQIRMGDSHIAVERRNGGQSRSLSLAHRFFECARKKEREKGVDPSRVVWFVMTDSEIVKRYATERYPHKVVTNSAGRFTHYTR
jgi:hypothetical protein